MPSSRKSTCCGSYGQIDKAVFHWFVGKRSLKVPIDGVTLTEKALEFVKTLGVKEFKASDCWLNKWKKRYKHNNSFLFALFCTTLNILTKNFQRMTIHSKVCRRISRNCMSWIMMPFNQIYQLNHLLIWIVKLSHLLLSLMMMTSTPKLLHWRMKGANMIKMMNKVHRQCVLQLMKCKTRWKRCNTFSCSVRAGTKFDPLY